MLGGLVGGSAGLIIGLLIGALLGYFGGPIVAPYVAVPEHQTLVASMTFTESWSGKTYELTPTCVASGSIGWGAGLPQSAFNYSKTYKQSTWLWSREGDAEAAMTIWGPDNSGKVFRVEIARLTELPLTATGNGHVLAQFPQGTANGYVVVDVSN
jgi:hypothetical protein